MTLTCYLLPVATDWYMITPDYIKRELVLVSCLVINLVIEFDI